MKIALSIVFLIGLALPGIAQQGAAPPKFPLSLRAPQMSSWTVFCTQKGDGPEKAMTDAFVQKLFVEKTYPIYHEVATVANGKSWEKWVIFDKGRDFQFIKYAGEPNWSRLSAGAYQQDSSNYSNSDFEDLQWADALTYKGVVSLGNGTAYSFEIKAGDRPMTKKEAAQFDYGKRERALRHGIVETSDSKVIALFDIQTLLPLKYDKGYEAFSYSFGAAPSGRLTPPAEITADYNKWLSEISARSR
jgi:hypothetical protein